MADDILVMYAGAGGDCSAEDQASILPPVHHRSAGCGPRVTAPRRSPVPIEGTPPNLINPVTGAPSARVAPIAKSGGQCQDSNGEPDLQLLEGVGEVTTLLHHLLRELKTKDELPGPEPRYRSNTVFRARSVPRVLEVRNVKKHFPPKEGALISAAWAL